MAEGAGFELLVPQSIQLDALSRAGFMIYARCAFRSGVGVRSHLQGAKNENDELIRRKDARPNSLGGTI